jgi:thioredoxin 1
LELPQLTSSGFGTVYKLMPETKKGVARIPVPPRNRTGASEPISKETVGAEERLTQAAPSGGARMLMSDRAAKPDPLTVPLIGLLLAFSVISLILQMLIAFSWSVRRWLKAQHKDSSLMSTESVTHLDETTFDQAVSATNVPILVDFWATWCGPCRMIAPVLDVIALEQGNAVRIAKVDVDNNPALSNRFGIRNIPTMLFFKSGEVKDQVVGLTSKADLVSRLNALK